MTGPIDKARQVLEEALERLPPEQDVANLTTEQVHFIITEAVSLEFDLREKEAASRRKGRSDTFWRWAQRSSFVLAPLFGFILVGVACGWF